MGITKDFDRREFTGFFDNYKFFIDPETNEIEIKFICDNCKTVMTKEEMLNGRWKACVTGAGGPLAYHSARFLCKECTIKQRKAKDEVMNDG